jgi:hypothetical protein
MEVEMGEQSEYVPWKRFTDVIDKLHARDLEIEQLRARVEEFEHLDLPAGVWYPFTDEQIVAAWNQAIKSPRWPARIDILEELGIFRCKRCGGNGKIVLPCGNGEHPCSGCDGYGWVIGDKNV